MVIERRIMKTSEVQRVCIENEYYNNGSNSDYNKLFEMIENLDYVFVVDIEKIAQNILDHTSREEEDLKLTTVMGTLAKTLHVFYVES